MFALFASPPLLVLASSANVTAVEFAQKRLPREQELRNSLGVGGGEVLSCNLAVAENSLYILHKEL